MFSFFGGKPKPRAAASELLRHAAKILRYRRDVIRPAALAEIETAVAALAPLLADRKTPGDAFAGPVATLDALLRKHGGTMHPLGMAADWTETFVIAAILAGGVRAFLFQPFKIPTNSMYPTFHGMTAHVYADGEPAPSAVRRTFRKIAFGATYLAPPSPVSGEILIPIGFPSPSALAQFENKTIDDGILGTGIWKGPADRHHLLVGDTRVPVVTPEEFDFRSTLLAYFFPKENALPLTIEQRWQHVRSFAQADDIVNRDGVTFLRTHRSVKAGEPLMRFDVLTGDMVIVDRASYNFVAPKVGDAFVFRTRDVPGFHGTRDDFYIKRLVGAPGDTLQVKDRKLNRNGVVASGNAGFDNNNAHRTELGYYGYTPTIRDGTYDLADPLTLPAGRYWAMGDNSANSSDSRYFGYVPENAIVGKSVFILYPFTNRTGPSK